jgi:cytochrome b
VGQIDRPHIDGAAESTGDVWDVLIRMAAVCLGIVLVLAYVTGEEFQHTHALIGYGLVAVVFATIYWELVRPQQARFRGSVFNAATLVSALRNARALPGKGTGAVAIFGVLLVLAVLALVTLALIVLTHSLWSAAAVDEMHEVVAYFSIGLVVFFVAVVLIASAEHLERALGRRPRR